MKKIILVLLFSIISFSSHAQNLTPGTYSDPRQIIKILAGHYDNFVDPACAKELLEITVNKANLALGNRIIALRVEAKSENGRTFFFIWPEFEQVIYGYHASKCYISNL